MSISTAQPGAEASLQRPSEKRQDLHPPDASSSLDHAEKPPPDALRTGTTVFDYLLVVKAVENPKAYSRRFKWLVTILAATCAALDPMSATTFYRETLLHLP